MPNGNNYAFFKGYQANDQLRAAFNDLAKKTFEIDFETWYQSGYWQERYIPYTLFDGNKAIANISVNIMQFNVFGEHKRYIQIGTVMTDEAYRNKGLSRLLMEKVIQEWNDQCDFIYLFANSTVWDFYPKLGFSPVREYVYSKKIQSKQFFKIENIDMRQQVNRDKIFEIAKHSVVFSKLAMQENANLVMFYTITLMQNDVYYIDKLDAFVIAKFKKHQLYLFDVFSQTENDLDKIIEAIATPETESIVLGFTPLSSSSYDIIEVDPEDHDERLFIQQGKTHLFDEHRLMFPTLSHA